MSTFLRFLGILSLIGGLLFGFTSPFLLIPSLASSIVSCVIFWWMAAMLDAARATAGNLEVIYTAIQAMTKQQAAAELAAEGATTLATGMRVHHPMLGDGKIVSTDGVRASVLFDGRDAEETVNATHLQRALDVPRR
ncbi:hypothetical protein EI613_27005 [Azospirillum sp. 412522]|nr:hypothetical protein [Azospirillum sp. 412522]MBY6265541.1 hypothetical protein [Azospirillum sp. 412522]